MSPKIKGTKLPKDIETLIQIDGGIQLLADPLLANSTTLHSKLVRQDIIYNSPGLVKPP